MSKLSPTLVNKIQQMTVDEQLELMNYLANLIKKNNKKSVNFSQKKDSLTKFIGMGKGCYPTPEDADNFIRQERDKWDY